MSENSMDFRSGGWMPEAPAVPMTVPEMDMGSDCAIPVMAYFNLQPWGEPYEVEIGIARGTIFPPLDLPFIGKGECPDDE